MLSDMATGLTGIAVGSLLGEVQAEAASVGPHHTPRATRVLQIFCPGGVSHMDTWEYKPALEKYDGRPLPGEEAFVSFQGKNGPLMRSPWGFQRHGGSGKSISDMLPHMGRHVDDIAFLHSMTSKSNTHGPGCVFMNTGYTADGFPSNGAWVSYALGSENDNLPTYVAITDVRGEPPSGPANWGAGFLPAEHQGISLNADTPIRNLKLPGGISPEADRASREFIEWINRRHAEKHPGDSQLAARMAAYRLAARMQLSAPEAADLKRESQATHRLYGTSDPNRYKAAYARNCLLARRLLERDVRFVTLYCASRASGVDGLLNWDAHKKLKADYERHCPIFDQPTAALLTDLKNRGLLADTLVLWTTEFGRMPTRQQGTAGRDHNPDGFTVWLMGAGVKGGVSYGATDEFGRRAAQDPCTVYDLYATVLHLLGLHFKKVGYYHNGLERRLTDVHGHVIGEVLA
jgi:hypothetical protein